jgi:Domain of unknown function (DUF1929)/Bacterial Ig domain
VITDAPGTVGYGTSFQIATPNAASIQKVGLIRLGSQTHSVEMEQRYVPLLFTAGVGSLTADVPANMNTAVPGVYMLFIVDSSGVPSVARMVQLDPAAPPPPPPPPPPPNQLPSVSLTSPANNARFTSPAKVSLAATASDADGTVIRVRVLQRRDKGGRGYDRAVHGSVEHRRRRHVHAQCTGDGQRRRNCAQQPGHDHHRQEALNAG